MYEFHKNKQPYFDWTYKVTRDYIIPMLAGNLDMDRKLSVLEIGSGEGGVLNAFVERGDTCVGIELSESRVNLAREFFPDQLATGQIKFIARDIYDIDVDKDLDERFDLVILKDVIEHIHDQKLFISRVSDFLKPEGKIFFGFPPWMMPFGGHQQLLKSKFLAKFPYFHLLPKSMYKSILQSAGETKAKVDNILEIKDTQISIERFERILEEENFKVYGKQHWLINPIYQFKFGIKARKQAGFLSGIPWLRNFYTTAVYYLVGK